MARNRGMHNRCRWQNGFLIDEGSTDQIIASQNDFPGTRIWPTMSPPSELAGSGESLSQAAVELRRARRFLLCAGVFPALSLPLMMASAVLMAHGLQLPVHEHRNGRPLPAISEWIFSLCLPGTDSSICLGLITLGPYLVLFWLLRRSKSVAWATLYFAGWGGLVFATAVFFACFAIVGFTAPFFEIIIGGMQAQ